jgi:uncharacterized alpha-E superfamily protein
MLSRTAENLFWVARYMERAETMARLLEVGSRISLTPSAGHGHRSDWESLLQASGTAEGFWAKYGDPVQRNIESYLFFDRDNPSSVISCIERARENARIVRTAITGQVWDTLNTAFQQIRQIERQPRSEMELGELCDWVNRQSALLRGSMDGTMLRSDGFFFMNLGYALERADNTARLIDVKYFVLLPSVEMVGSGLDNHQWRVLLRALNAHRAFHWAYGGEITSAKIVDFLILNQASPRSLLSSTKKAMHHLDNLATYYNKPAGPAQESAQALVAALSATPVPEIFDEGLHEFLTRFIQDIGALTGLVQRNYLSGEAR